MCLRGVDGHNFTFLFRESKLVWDPTNMYAAPENYAVEKQPFSAARKSL